MVRDMASNPLPCMSNLCPGNTESAVDGSGAPKKIEGMKSKIVWVIAMEIAKEAKEIGDIPKARKKDELPKRMKQTELTWIPGIKPVNTPTRIPRRIKDKISRNILV